VARWRGHDARAKTLIYAHGRKELPTQLYRANVSQPVRPAENFPYISQKCLPMAGLLRFDRQSPDFQFATSQANPENSVRERRRLETGSDATTWPGWQARVVAFYFASTLGLRVRVSQSRTRTVQQQ